MIPDLVSIAKSITPLVAPAEEAASSLESPSAMTGFAATLAACESEKCGKERLAQDDLQAKETEASSPPTLICFMPKAESMLGVAVPPQSSTPILNRAANIDLSNSALALEEKDGPARAQDFQPWTQDDVLASDGLSSSARESLEPVVFDEGPLSIHVASIETHLPIAIAQALPTLPAERPVIPTETAAQAQPEPQPAETALKILKFEIEPASLGAILVKIRLTAARVEIEIDAQSRATAVLLLDSRERLVSAIADRGHVLDSFDVQISAPTAPPSHTQAADAGRSAPSDQQFFSGESASRHDERPRRGSGGQPPENKPHEDRHAGGHPAGVFV